MASQGPFLPYDAYQSGGGATWANPTSIEVEDEAFASFSGANGTVLSKALFANFTTKFTIPTGAVIDGVFVAIKRKASHREYINEGNYHFAIDTTVRLFDDYTGVNKALVGSFDYAWPLANAWQGYGGASDTWGVSLTPGLINSLVVMLIAQVSVSDATTVTAYVDAVRATVYYTISGYQHKVIGIAPANIGKIMGVPRANIAKFNGV